jgi:hypothetical protein
MSLDPLTLEVCGTLRKRMGMQKCMYLIEGKDFEPETWGDYQPAINAGWLKMCDPIIRKRTCTEVETSPGFEWTRW